MAVQEGDINPSAFLDLNPEMDINLQARSILSDVLHVMEENPDLIASSVDASVEIYTDEVKKKPEVMPLITPVRAVSVYLDQFVRKPLVEASTDFPDPAGEVLGSVSKGVFMLSNALAEADGAMSLGVAKHVMNALVQEAKHLPSRERSELIASRREFRTYLTERRLGFFMKDLTGSDLMLREFYDVVDLSRGVSPYEGYSVKGNPLNPTSVEGASFVLNAYNMIYRQAREQLGEGKVVSR